MPEFVVCPTQAHSSHVRIVRGNDASSCLACTRLCVGGEERIEKIVTLIRIAQASPDKMQEKDKSVNACNKVTTG